MTDEHKQAIRGLFVRMKGIYGQLWSSRFTSKDAVAAAAAEWAKALLKYSPQQIGNAIERCIREYEMPPSLPQFLRLLETPGATFHKPFPKALPKPPANRELARSAITEMRSMFGRQQHETGSA